MPDPSGYKPSIKNLGAIKRKTISTAQDAWIKTSQLRPSQVLPLLIQPIIEGVKLVDWAKGNQETIETFLLKHGGILFRGFDIQSAAEFEKLISTVAGDLLEYTYRSTPR